MPGAFAWGRAFLTVRQAQSTCRYVTEAAHSFNHDLRIKELLPRLAVPKMRCVPHAEARLRAMTSFLG
jgi:hypothetical protein